MLQCEHTVNCIFRTRERDDSNNCGDAEDDGCDGSEIS